MHPTGKLIERFTVKFEDGHACEASIYETARRGGRRIVLVEHGACVFDSQDCFDLANAMASMDRWMEAQGIEIEV